MSLNLWTRQSKWTIDHPIERRIEAEYESIVDGQMRSLSNGVMQPEGVADPYFPHQ